MTPAIVFHDLAEREFLEVIRFYLAISPELADTFASEVERAASLLSLHPLLGKLVETGVRSWPLAKFPYSLYYRAIDDGLEILAVGHQRRRPLYWKSRG